MAVMVMEAQQYRLEISENNSTEKLMIIMILVIFLFH